MNKKGFTLIELMIVIVIVGIMAAIVIPQFAQFRINNAAEDFVARGVPVSQIKDEGVRNRVIDLLSEQRAENQKIQTAEKLQTTTNNTVIPVLKPETVPQSVNNTVIPVLIPDTVITCKNRDTLLSRCTLNFNQSGIRYTIPMNCELTELNTYKCEIM